MMKKYMLKQKLKTLMVLNLQAGNAHSQAVGILDHVSILIVLAYSIQSPLDAGL